MDESFEAVIGLEVHAQVLTRSKMFCSCSSDYVDAPPNSHVCAICLGSPGVLPVINRRAVEATIMTALALNCEIPEYSKFDRKNYPYPDLVKGYQITQFDAPFSRDGHLTIEVDGAKRRIGITRVHLEEDTARLVHRNGPDGVPFSLVDVNRSGTPLMEIVGEPDIRSPAEAREYLITLRRILQYLGVSTGNMEEGSFRCDANISVRPVGSSAYGTKVEVKNMNSFQAVHDALEYEIERQIRMVREGERIVQETRGWVEQTGRTVSQRSKEQAHDYRYFPEPDLPPLLVGREWVAELRASLPELPELKRSRFIAEYGLPPVEAAILTETRDFAEFYEATVAAVRGKADAARAPKLAANWLLNDLRQALNASGESVDAVRDRVRPELIGELVGLVEAKTITSTAAKDVFGRMFQTGTPPGRIVEEQGLGQIGDQDAILAAVREAIAANPRAVADFHGGKQAALKALIGPVMKATRGRADAAVVTSLLERELAG
jgi:aspartyl-tRNA(Asn)/glutamyl-tRNA(Gln) amidotransferase subunit B